MGIGFDISGRSEKELKLAPWWHWWTGPTPLRVLDYSRFMEAILPAMSSQGLLTNRTVECLSIEGTRITIPAQDCIDFFTNLGGFVVASSFNHDMDTEDLAEEPDTKNIKCVPLKDRGSLIIFHPEWAVSLYLFGVEDSLSIALSALSLDKELLDKLKGFFQDVVTIQASERVYMLKQAHGDITYSSHAVDFSKREDTNYSKTVNDQIDYINTVLPSKDPFGRLVILEGPPGTGKTHLVRSMIASMDVTPLIMPPNMVPMLGRPELVPVLENLYNHFPDRPILLVIEDADVILSERDRESTNAISATLNLTDGILGALFDIRILATSNIAVDQIDPALLRPGRLLKRVSVGLLSLEESKVVFKRLLPNEDYPIEFENENGQFSLAQIYELVYNVKLAKGQ